MSCHSNVDICQQLPEPDLPYMQKPLPLLDTTFTLFGFIPEDSDPRWQFLMDYHEVKARTDFQPINFSNAWGATYLSDQTSYRSGFVNSINPENNLQLERALSNLSSIGEVSRRYDQLQDTSSDNPTMSIQYALTDRLTTDPTKPKYEVTPCPEALHQLRLRFCGSYLARIGFNVHQEDGKPILSIVNIQGTPGSVIRNQEFTNQCGISPFNLLTRKVISLAELEAPSMEVRGLINPEKGNSKLYWCALNGEGVRMYHAHRKPAQQLCE